MYLCIILRNNNHYSQMYFCNQGFFFFFFFLEKVHVFKKYADNHIGDQESFLKLSEPRGITSLNVKWKSR